MRPKTFLRPGAPQGIAEVAKGDIEIGLDEVSEIVAAQAVTLVGPYPGELHNTLVFAAAARTPDAGHAFVSALVSGEARARLKAAGLDVTQ